MRTLLLILLTLLAFPAFPAPFTKIANNGADLPDSAVLGSGAGDWACTRDNATWRIWEVKTADGGLRDMNKTYTNYDNPDSEQKRTGSSYVSYARPTQAEIDAASNSIGFLKAVNSTALCGSNDWRRPGVEELRDLEVQSDSPNNDPPFFPNTPSGELHDFWSLSVYWGPIPSSPSQFPYLAWSWSSTANHAHGTDRGNHEYVRFVRNGESSGTFGLALNATGSGNVVEGDDGSRGSRVVKQRDTATFDRKIRPIAAPENLAFQTEHAALCDGQLQRTAFWRIARDRAVVPVNQCVEFAAAQLIDVRVAQGRQSRPVGENDIAGRVEFNHSFGGRLQN